MRIICDKCGYIVDKDKYIKGQIVEEYNNIYGTHCPKCGNLIKSYKKIPIIDENELKKEILREKIRNSIRRKINVNRRKT